MTTQRELGEMLIEVYETGRKLQYRVSNGTFWLDCDRNHPFNVRIFEYRLEPKIVKHEGWTFISDAVFDTKEEAERLYKGFEIGHVTWETKE